MDSVATDRARTAVREWVEKYSDELFRRAFYRTSDRGTAEDLVQETFLAAFQSYSKFEGKSQPKTWLFSILNNKIIDYHRKKFRNPEITESMIGSDDDKGSILEKTFDSEGIWKKGTGPAVWHDLGKNVLDDPEFSAVFHRCMKALPENWLSAVSLKYLLEKKGPEICKELGITPSNFWQILHRAKLQLKDCLEKNWFKE